MGEKIVRAALKELRTKAPCAFIRLYDTTSASNKEDVNYIPEQPCDFLLTRAGQTFLIEVKASETKSSLTKDMLKRQRGHFKIWHRAGAINLAVFIDLKANTFQIWPGEVAWLGVRRLKPNAEGVIKELYTSLALLTFVSNH